MIEHDAVVYRSGEPNGQAERLAVEGLRHWMAGYATGDITHWQAAWEIHVDVLGHNRARCVIEHLARWARTLNDCSACPLRDLCCNLDRTRDECLAVAAIAACQYGDSACLDLCLAALVPNAGCAAAMAPAIAYAHVMAEVGLVLDPVPMDLVKRLTERPSRQQLH